MPFSYNRELISGFQISVVPKDIPGVDADSLFGGVSGGYFGSVGAIVGPDQHSFVVRQLTPRVRYIFQIMAIALDGQTSGPASSIEFRPRQLSDEQDDDMESSSEARLVDSYSRQHTTTVADFYYLNDGSSSRNRKISTRLVLVGVFVSLLFRVF